MTASEALARYVDDGDAEAFRVLVHQYQRLEWCANGTLQLQCLAHEQIGCGQWTQCDEDVPVVKDEGKVGLCWIWEIRGSLG